MCMYWADERVSCVLHCEVCACVCENLSFVMMERTAVGFIHETSRINFSHKFSTSPWLVVLKKNNTFFTFSFIYLNKLNNKYQIHTLRCGGNYLDSEKLQFK